MIEDEVDQRAQRGGIAQTGAQRLRIEPGQRQHPLSSSLFRDGPSHNAQGKRNRLLIGTYGIWSVHEGRFRGLTPIKRSSGMVERALVKKRVLVVEDNELNLKLFCDLLAAHGFETDAVRDGRDAYGRARAFTPDLIITDIQLPHVTGLELIAEMRGDAALASVPIMAVTAYAGLGDEERIRGAGANAYVSKPISVARFIGVVNDLLEAGPVGDSPPRASSSAVA